METKSTAQPPYCPRCGIVSSGAHRTAASVLTWLPHAWACSAAPVKDRERVVAGWPGSHPVGPTASCWRAAPFFDKTFPSAPVGTWDVGKTGHPLPSGRSAGPPDHKRASAAAVTSCGCDVGYGRVSSFGGIVCGSSDSSGGSRGDGGCGDGGRRKSSSKWVGPSSLLQGPGCSECGHLGP